MEWSMRAGGLDGGLQGAGLLLSAGASVYILHALLSYLPLCFTIGGSHPAPTLACLRHSLLMQLPAAPKKMFSLQGLQSDDKDMIVCALR